MERTFSDLETEIEILNEALIEADELTSANIKEIQFLRKRNNLLETRLNSYGIGFEDIDRLLDAE